MNSCSLIKKIGHADRVAALVRVVSMIVTLIAFAQKTAQAASNSAISIVPVTVVSGAGEMPGAKGTNARLLNSKTPVVNQPQHASSATLEVLNKDTCLARLLAASALLGAVVFLAAGFFSAVSDTVAAGVVFIWEKFSDMKTNAFGQLETAARRASDYDRNLTTGVASLKKPLLLPR